jgi:CheY-like chemotaxis protein
MANILVVDDDSEVLSTLANIVKAGGHTVATAASGTEALDLLDRGIPLDLMLTDVIMPGLNGFNLARMARSRRRGLKILYLTGYSEQEVASRDSGDRYGKMLNKPILPSELRDEVDSALSREVG